MEKQQIENLLNDIYAQPDLKGGVFSYLQPHILKAYGLLKRDQLSIQTGRTTEVLFTDIDKKIDMENILYRDLPEIIDVYSKMPLEYRNEHRLKNGKTHRQLLLDNLEILTHKLQALETSVYEGFDQKMSVKNRVFTEKYKEANFLTNGALEYEPITQSDDYRWKKPVETALLNRDFIKEEKNSDNQRIVLTEGVIEYKVKDKFQHFMTGTYNVFNNSKRNIMEFTQKATNKFLNPFNTYRPTKPDKIMGAIISSVSIGLIYFAGSAVVIGTSEYINSKPSDNLVKTVKAINLDNHKLRELSLLTMEKMSAEKNIKVEYSPNKEVVTLSVIADKNECMQNTEVMYRSTIIDYNVNGVDLRSIKQVGAELIGQICQPKDNIVSVKKSLKIR